MRITIWLVTIAVQRPGERKPVPPIPFTSEAAAKGYTEEMQRDEWWAKGAGRTRPDGETFPSEWEMAPHIIDVPVPDFDPLVSALRKIIGLAPKEQPQEEDFDDTESAYNNGIDVAAWEAARVALAGLNEAGIPVAD